MRVSDVGELTRAFGEKYAGLALEFAGTIASKDGIRDRGRNLEKSGDKRLRAIDRHVKADASQDESHGRKSGSDGSSSKSGHSRSNARQSTSEQTRS